MKGKMPFPCYYRKSGNKDMLAENDNRKYNLSVYQEVSNNNNNNTQ